MAHLCRLQRCCATARIAFLALCRASSHASLLHRARLHRPPLCRRRPPLLFSQSTARRSSLRHTCTHAHIHTHSLSLHGAACKSVPLPPALFGPWLASAHAAPLTASPLTASLLKSPPRHSPPRHSVIASPLSHRLATQSPPRPASRNRTHQELQRLKASNNALEASLKQAEAQLRRAAHAAFEDDDDEEDMDKVRLRRARPHPALLLAPARAPARAHRSRSVRLPSRMKRRRKGTQTPQR